MRHTEVMTEALRDYESLQTASDEAGVDYALLEQLGLPFRESDRPCITPELASSIGHTAATESSNHLAADLGLPPLDIDDAYWKSLGRLVMAPQEQTVRQPVEAPRYGAPLPPLDHFGFKRLEALDEAGRLSVDIGVDTQPLQIVMSPTSERRGYSPIQQLRDMAIRARTAIPERAHNTWQHARSDLVRARDAASNWFAGQRDALQQDGVGGLLQRTRQAAAERCSFAIAELKDFVLDQVPAAAALTGVITAMWLEDVAVFSIGRSFRARSPMPFVLSLTMPLAATLESLAGEVMHDVRFVVSYSSTSTSRGNEDYDVNDQRRPPQDWIDRKWAGIDAQAATIGAGIERLIVDADPIRAIEAPLPTQNITLLGDASRATKPLAALEVEDQSVEAAHNGTTFTPPRVTDLAQLAQIDSRIPTSASTVPGKAAAAIQAALATEDVRVPFVERFDAGHQVYRFTPTTGQSRMSYTVAGKGMTRATAKTAAARILGPAIRHARVENLGVMPFFAPRSVDPQGKPIPPITNQAELDAYLARNIPVLRRETIKRLAAEQHQVAEIPDETVGQAD